MKCFRRGIGGVGHLGAWMAVLVCVLSAPVHSNPAQTDLWTATHPLPELLFSVNAPCRHASSKYPEWGQSTVEQFLHYSVLGTRELLSGLCLEGAGVSNEATHAFLKARTRFVEAIDVLVADAQRREKELRDRRDLVNALGQGLSALLESRARTPSQALQARQSQTLINLVTDAELRQIDAGMKSLALERPAQLTRTIRIPVVPAAGFLKHIVRVEHAKGYCTGSFVGPRIVLTNLHCLPFGTTPSTVGVVRDLVVASEKFTVKTWWTFRGERGTLLQDEMVSTCSRSYCDDDWALLELNETRGDADDYLFVAPRTPKLSSVMVAGYSGDVSQGAYVTLDLNCPVDSASSQANRKGVIFQCSTFKGSSGSPVLSMFDQRVVVALNNSLWDRENTATTRGMTGAVRVELFAPKLYELLGSRPPDWVSDEAGSRRFLSHAKVMYEQRQKPLELPKWND